MVQEISNRPAGGFPLLDARRTIRLRGISRDLQRHLEPAPPERARGSGPPTVTTPEEAVKGIGLSIELEDKYAREIGGLLTETRPAVVLGRLAPMLLADKVQTTTRGEVIRRAAHLVRAYQRANPPAGLRVPEPGTTTITPRGRGEALKKSVEASSVLADTSSYMAPEQALAGAARAAILRAVGADGCPEEDLRPLHEEYGGDALAKAFAGLKSRLRRAGGRITLRP